MERRSKAQRGFVRFPVDDPAYTNTGEGGLFVRLVVEDSPETWMVCCGGHQQVHMDESHLIPLEEPATTDDTPRDRHFPDYLNHELPAGDMRQYMSLYYLCIITLGSTGWSGWHEKAEEYFRCTFSDLTEEGQRLYRLVEQLYPGCRVSLQTWLDT